MHRFALSRSLLLLALLVLLAVGIVAQQQRLFERAWFNWNQWREGPSADSIGLDRYRVVLEAKVIDGVDNDLSALTFDPQRRSLFTVTNQTPELIELTLQGDIVRRIALNGFGDAEAVEYISPGVYVISDERRHRLVKVQVNEQTTSLDAANAEQLSLGIGLNGNKGFEGLAYDSVGRRLFVAKERDPMLIYEIQGFPHDPAQGPYAVQVKQDRKRDAALFVTDLSSLQYDQRSAHLLALSDESRLVLEIGEQGLPLSSLSLRKGRHGLHSTVPQAEGIAMDEEGTLYMVSEPNLFYVFRKP